MRLLRVDDDLSLHFEEFIGSEIPPYAILSHTWEKEEVSYDDFVSGRGPGMKGYKKITGCAEKAKRHELDYIWVDTCCETTPDPPHSSTRTNMLQVSTNAAVLS